MKVVLFCGGLGTRMREHSQAIPKPLATIGTRPILWHLMRYYAHFGHTDFVLCLGYGGDLIREYIEREQQAEPDWTVELVETGLDATIGERLLAVAPQIEGEGLFLANYSDGLSDLPLPHYLDAFQQREAVAGFITVKISQSFHMVTADADGQVNALTRAQDSDVWINGGFFALRPEILDYVRPGDELVEQPFRRLMDERLLYAFRHAGFWAAVDTYKDKVRLDGLSERGDAPWEVWKTATSSRQKG